MAISSTRILPFLVDKYECREHVGGNMSEVYLAYDAKADRQVIVKLLKPEDCEDPYLRQRFLHEGRLACRCSHPNLITTYETDEQDGHPYIVMEYLRGQSLRSLMNSGGLTTQIYALEIALQVAAGLQYLHSIGILHRDVKPTNINVSDTGQVKIFDFGIARAEGFSLTRVGDVMGTPGYMAPEQIMGKQVTAATDIYSFGVLLFEMLTLQKPYEATTFEELTAVILNSPPKTELLRQLDVPEQIAKLIEDCLQKAPEARPKSFEVICETLRNFLAPDSTRKFVPGTGFTSSRRIPRSESPERPRIIKWKIWISIGFLLVVAASAALWLARKHVTNLTKPIPESKQVTNTPQTTIAPPGELPRILTLTSGDMVLVPGGQALLGEHREPTFVDTFYIDKTEVPLRTYLEFCKETGWDVPKDTSRRSLDLPAVNVSYDDAARFARWAGKRLPTWKEWEKAARGSEGLLYPWGNQFRRGLANLLTENKGATLAPVKSFPKGASPAGAVNMLGNVWEWVDTPADAPLGEAFENYREHQFRNLVPPLSPREPYYQIRGGSWRFPISESRVPDLLWEIVPFPERARQPDVGFRCARDASH